MEGKVRTSYSEILGRDMSYKTFGKRGGRLCIAFAPQNGRYWDFENFGMVETIMPWIESGEIYLVLADSMDEISWSGKDIPGSVRAENQERWYHYIIDELYPSAKRQCGNREKAIAIGCSMGGYHAGNFFFRRPDKFSAMVSLSGTFNSDLFFGSYMDSVLYDNCPAAFLRNMPLDHPWVKLYRESTIITCCGQGAWEDDLLRGTRELDAILTGMNIPHFSDYWGYDVNHDWPWWRVQLPYFFSNFVLKK
ncbi:MAG: alpha/beta hydrolase-fold protein [Bullifex sp.]|nr:alpha/beta hydrolase-fold protein [Bullifex sp.]